VIPEILISHAGQGIHEKLLEGDPEKWAKVIDINLVGALRFVRTFFPIC
jgi:NADP-dependent 3-hydroxy acid dehydrogenase YdfG